MELIGVVFRAELRNRWRQWLALVLLTVVAGGFALAAAAAGFRTQAAFQQFVKGYGFDGGVYAFQPVPKVAHLPGVTSAAEFVGPFSGPATCACEHAIPPNDLSTGVLLGDTYSYVKLLSGRRPNPSNPYEVLASFNLEQDDGVHVGTVVHLRLYAASQLRAIATSVGAPPPPRGPEVALHVVGIEASEDEFPIGSSPSYDIYATSAFLRTIVPKTASAYVYIVRLHHGAADVPRFTALVTGLSSSGVEGFLNEDISAVSVEASIHPQALGWWILAVLAALIGAAVVGQAIARQTSLERGIYPSLLALGVKRRQFLALGMARNLAVAVLGAAGAIGLSIALSPIAPLGEARIAESSSGPQANLAVLLIGAGAIVVFVLLVGLPSAIRAARTIRTDAASALPRPSSIASRLGLIGAPASMVIGVRHALQRRSGAVTVPVGTAVLGTVLAVSALCGTGVFGASLTHLTRTPKLYGDAFQLNFTDLTPTPNSSLVRSLEADNAVISITHGIVTQTSINGTAVGGIAATSFRGPILFSTVNGHFPNGDGQIGLGASTMRVLHAHVGSTVPVTFAQPSGKLRTVRFRVVGQISFPVLGGNVGLGIGDAFTIPGYEHAICPQGSARATCEVAASQTGGGGLLVGVVGGQRGKAAVARYQSTYRSIVALPITPVSLINFGEAVNFPLIFGVLLAIFGAATLVHMLAESVSRRRREIGTLEVLGFVRRQVIASVAWQATTLAVVGVIFGVPIGLVVGKTVWTSFASGLGAVPVPVIPVGIIALLVAGELLLANVLAVIPALIAARFHPGRLLRTQ